MDGSVLSGLSAGGLTGAVVACFYVLYKCLRNKKLRSKCCGAEFTVSNDDPPPAPIVIEEHNHHEETEKKERRTSVVASSDVNYVV